MNFDYQKVFITGSGGWLGQRLIERTLFKNDARNSEYLSDFNLYCHSLEDSDINFNQNFYSKFTGSLTIKKNCEEFLSNADNTSLLIHTAGIIHPKKVSEFFDINLLATKSLIEIAIKQGVKKMIVISSNSPIGCNKNNQKENFFNETSAYNPYMNYGKSKMQMEEMLADYINQGIDITILRPPWFYGKGMPARQLEFYKMIIAGRFPFIGSGNNIRSIVNIDNIIDCIYLAAINPISKGETYWVSDDGNMTMNEIVNTISEMFSTELLFDVKKNRIHLPDFVGVIAEKVDQFLQYLGLYNQKIHVLSEMNKNIACTNKKAKIQLGYQPKVSLYKGTEDAYRDYIRKSDD